MNIKKEAADRIINKLNRELEDIKWSLRENTNRINHLSDEQRVLKKQRNELIQLIRGLDNK